MAQLDDTIVQQNIQQLIDEESQNNTANGTSSLFNNSTDNSQDNSNNMTIPTIQDVGIPPTEVLSDFSPEFAIQQASDLQIQSDQENNTNQVHQHLEIP